MGIWVISNLLLLGENPFTTSTVHTAGAHVCHPDVLPIALRMVVLIYIQVWHTTVWSRTASTAACYQGLDASQSGG